MPQQTKIQTNFTAGEISPRLLGRVDISKYENGAKTLENFIVFPHGGITSRGGSKFIAEVKDSSKVTRLVPFEFSTTQAYIIEMGDQYFRFYKDGAIITLGDKTITNITQANPAVVTSASHGYSNGDHVYIDDVVGMTRVNGRRFTVANVATNTFELSGIDSTGYTAYSSGGVANKVYEISSSYLEAELFEIKFTQSADTLYIVHPNHAPATLTRSGHTSWTLANISFTANPFGASNYPGSVAFYEERLVFAGSDNNPQRMWFSKSGDYTNMTTGTADDDAIIYTIATDQVNRIRWLMPREVLLVGTVGGEFKVSASSLEEAITPTNIRVVRQSSFGTANITPKLIGVETLFIQRAERKMRAMSYSFEKDSYTSPDLTIISEHITQSGVKEMAYQQEPDSIVWMVLSDGTLVGATFERDQQVIAWHKHSFSGDVETVATIYEGDRDELWIIVERTIDGGTKRYVELLQQGLTEDDTLTEAFYVDSGLEYSGSATTTIIGLDHLEGETVSMLVNGATHPDKTVTDGSVTLDVEATDAVIGLQFTPLVETLPIEAAAPGGSTAQGKLKRTHHATLRLYRSLGGEIGKATDDTTPIYYRSSADEMDEALGVYTGDKRETLGGGWDRQGTIVVTQPQPLPMTILSIISDVQTNR